MRNVFYVLLSILLFVLILEHFFMSSLLTAAYRQVSSMGQSTTASISQSSSDLPQEDDYDKKLAKLKSLPKVYDKAAKELRELDSNPGMSPQASEIRNYLDWLFSLPWLKKDKTDVDLEKAKKILDRDHQGLEKAKEHILEYLAVQKRVPNGKAPVLCFVGPPGVGKTTLAKSIAEATGRKFVRVSLGGVREEASIRGFMRTYVGSKPGKIIEALKEAGTSNPVILLDELDKVGMNNHHGDPAAALLEVLDPAQNKDFKDHFLEIGVDLSQVMFICTSNSLEMHPALRDRLEIVELSSYTQEEKLNIAKKNLIPKEIKENGLKENELSITDDAVKHLINEYTLEAGVRQLDRMIGTLCRKAIKEFYDGKSQSVSITPESLEKYLGHAKVPEEKLRKEHTVGMTTGLAWTSVGGRLLPLEAMITPGNGKVLKTGNFGKVQQESITTALTVVKTMLPAYGVNPNFLDKHDLHIHAPNAGVKKDGPSAGITTVTSIISAITNIPVSRDVCMTGEITLNGQVMPIGGLKEKLIAAHTAGVKTALIPIDNVGDLEEVPQQVKDEMNIIPVKHISEVLKVALLKGNHVKGA
jgi:ATP-dependent Lon protease